MFKRRCILQLWAATLIFDACALQYFSAKDISGSLSRGKCVVFHSQHKSAGNTINNVLRQYNLEPAKGFEAANSTYHSCDLKTWNCELNTCSNLFELTARVYEQPIVAVNGYTLRLAGDGHWGSPRGGPCVWATMARDPVPRLVSAFLYCKRVGRADPLCGLGKSSLDFSKASIQDFAKAWGNYLFREILWHPELYKLAAGRDDFIDQKKCHQDYIPGGQGLFTAKSGPRAPWQTLQMQLNGGDDPRTASGLANMQAVERYLTSGKLYDVIGINDEFESSMSLLDRFIPLHKIKWIDAAKAAAETHDSETYKDEEERLLKEAENDQEVLDAIAGDIHLYRNILVPKFKSQFK